MSPLLTATIEPIELESDASEAKIVDATLRCLARYGYAKTTVDDIAREAGVSRATVYRLIGGKSQLFDRALIWEVTRIRDRAARLAQDITDLADRVTTIFVATSRELLAHEVVTTLLSHEAEAIVSYCAVHGEAIVQAAADVFAPLFTGQVTPQHARTIAEFLARITISTIGSAARWIDLSNPQEVRDLVVGYVLPRSHPQGATS